MLEFISWSTRGKKNLQPTAQLISHIVFKTLHWPNSFLNHTEGRNSPINYCSSKEVSSYWLHISFLDAYEPTAWPTKLASYTSQRHMAAGGKLWPWFAPLVPLQDRLSESRWWMRVLQLCSPIPAGDTQPLWAKALPYQQQGFLFKGVDSLDWDKNQDSSSAVRSETLTVQSGSPAILIAKTTGWVEQSPAPSLAPNRAVRDTWVQGALGTSCSPCPQWHQKVCLYLRLRVSCVSHSSHFLQLLLPFFPTSTQPPW